MAKNRLGVGIHRRDLGVTRWRQPCLLDLLRDVLNLLQEVGASYVAERLQPQLVVQQGIEGRSIASDGLRDLVLLNVDAGFVKRLRQVLLKLFSAIDSGELGVVLRVDRAPLVGHALQQRAHLLGAVETHAVDQLSKVLKLPL